MYGPWIDPPKTPTISPETMALAHRLAAGPRTVWALAVVLQTFGFVPEHYQYLEAPECPRKQPSTLPEN